MTARTGSDAPVTLTPSGVQIVLGTGDPAATAAAYERLLAVPPDAAGAFSVAGDELRFGAVDRVRFGVADVAAAAGLLQRRGMSVDTAASTADLSGGLCGLVATGDRGSMPTATGGPAVRRLDHTVIAAADPEQAIALFSGVLGLDYRLRLEPWAGVTQLFFRSGPAVIEVVCGVPDAESVSGPGDLAPSLWGLAWRCDDIEITRDRLRAAGVAVRPIKAGRQPNSRVATVDDPGLVTRTLLIEKSGPRQQ